MSLVTFHFYSADGAFHAAEEMRKRKIDSNKCQFVFGQIYGMGEQLSMPLGKIISQTVSEHTLPSMYNFFVPTKICLSSYNLHEVSGCTSKLAKYHIC